MLTSIIGRNNTGKTTMLLNMYNTNSSNSSYISTDSSYYNYNYSMKVSEERLDIIEDIIYADKILVGEKNITTVDYDCKMYSDKFIKILEAILSDVEFIYIDEIENNVTYEELMWLLHLFNITKDEKNIIVTTHKSVVYDLAENIISIKNLE